MIRTMFFGGVLAICCILRVSDAHAMDAAREALFTAHPEIADEPLRRAIGEAAMKKGAAGDTVSAFNGHRTVLYACTRAGNARGRVVSLNLIGTLA
jgi:hypothetical protein